MRQASRLTSEQVGSAQKYLSASDLKVSIREQRRPQPALAPEQVTNLAIEALQPAHLGRPEQHIWVFQLDHLQDQGRKLPTNTVANPPQARQ